MTRPCFFLCTVSSHVASDVDIAIDAVVYTASTWYSHQGAVIVYNSVAGTRQQRTNII